jgi:aspartate aminotransferase
MPLHGENPFGGIFLAPTQYKNKTHTQGDKMASYLADRTSAIDASGIRKVFALAATMKNPINFSIGQPDFDVPENIKLAAIHSIRAGQNRYSQTPGLPALREKIASAVTAEFGWDNPQTLVTSGVSGALQLMFMSLINPGDEVIIPDPYFVIYKHMVNLLGGKCVYVDSYPDFSLPVEGIEAAITDKTKLILLNSPANPTGAVYSDAECKAISEIARQNDIILMSDEIYRDFVYDDTYTSPALYYEKTLILRGFSKNCAMTGWRMGYVAAEETLAHLIEQMTKIQQYTFVCAPTPFQEAAIVAMDHDCSPYVADYSRKSDMIFDGLKDKFGLLKPAGAFYAFVPAPGGQATAFVEKAIKNNVLIIPGSVFSEKDTHFRISYATTDEMIEKGVDVLNSIA